MLTRLILLLTYPDGHSDLASLMPKKQLSINIPVDKCQDWNEIKISFWLTTLIIILFCHLAVFFSQYNSSVTQPFLTDWLAAECRLIFCFDTTLLVYVRSSKLLLQTKWVNKIKKLPLLAKKVPDFVRLFHFRTASNWGPC